MVASESIHVVLCEDALLEILVRLPSKSVLRCRAVCKSWRRITTARSFLAAHAARRPRQMLVITESCTVRAVPLSLYPALAPAPDDDNDDMGRRGYLCDPITRGKGGRVTMSLGLVASLDGMLLLQQSPGHYVLCNPTTRQWSKMPALDPRLCSTVYPCGFYFHCSSGEYRLLCHYVKVSASKNTSSPDLSSWEEYCNDYYYIISTSGDLPRRLARAPAYKRPNQKGYEYPMACREILHWCSFRPEATSTGKILAFHTVTETFRLVARPSCNNAAVALLELEGALCAMTFEDASLLNIWVLQDYESDRWMLRNQVQVVVPSQRNLRYDDELLVGRAIYDGRNTILIGHPYSSRLVWLYDLKEKKVRPQFDTISYPKFLVFSESLVLHAFFKPPWCFELGPVKFCDQLDSGHN